jgi:hypothetical protein
MKIEGWCQYKNFFLYYHLFKKILFIRFPGENDQYAKYFPSFESWIKALSDRKEAEFKKEVPSDVS